MKENERDFEGVYLSEGRDVLPQRSSLHMTATKNFSRVVLFKGSGLLQKKI